MKTNDMIMSNNNSAMATLWKHSVLLSCRGDTKFRCCHDVWELLQDVCSLETHSWCLLSEMDKKRYEFHVLCTIRMAQVPNLLLMLDDATQTNTHHLWHALFLSSTSHVEVDTISWKQYVNGRWNEGPMVSPFPSEITNNGVTFSANIHSSLSPDGGMHRLLHHAISIKCPEETTESYQASLTMLVFVTEHFFVDIDDPLLSSHDGGVATLVSRERIDIEQPAFVSPQHVIMVQVTMDDGRCNETTTYSFATKLHVRYPPLTTTGHFDIVFPAPLLRSGWLAMSQQQNYTLEQQVTWQPPILLNVATGWQDDYAWVGIVTILWSLVGSILLLRDLSKVSKWN